MKIRFPAVLALLLGLAAPAGADPGAYFEDPFLTTAIGEARRTLDHFFRNHAGAEWKGAHALLVMVPSGGPPEDLVWVVDIAELGAGSYQGTVASQTAYAGLAEGMPLDFRRGDIADWQYTTADGTIHGSFIMRNRMHERPEAEAAETIRRLAPLP